MMASKGVSPLIASVLLIAVTVTIATLLTGWTSGLTRSTQDSVGNKTLQAADCASAAIAIDDVYLQDMGSNSTVRVIARNSGQSGLTVQSVTVFNKTGGSASVAGVGGFEMGEIATFTITNAPIDACANFSAAVVTTGCGSVSARFTKAPSCS